MRARWDALHLSSDIMITRQRYSIGRANASSTYIGGFVNSLSRLRLHVARL